jgi:hypothetical protein
VWHITSCTSRYKPGNQSTWNDTGCWNLDFAHRISSHNHYLCVNLFSGWHLENPRWMNGEILGSNGTINITCYSFTTVQVLCICLLQHMLFRRLSEMYINKCRSPTLNDSMFCLRYIFMAKDNFTLSCTKWRHFRITDPLRNAFFSISHIQACICMCKQKLWRRTHKV